MKFDWHSLSQREQWLVLFGGVFSGVMLIYLLVIEPLQSTVVQKQNRLTEKVETLDWMKQVQHDNQKQPKRQKLDHSQLLTQISNQLKTPSFKEYPCELQQNSQGDIQVTFKSVPYTLYLQWLRRLTMGYQVQVKQLTIEKTDTSGVVKTNLLVSVK